MTKDSSGDIIILRAYLPRKLHKNVLTVIAERKYGEMKEYKKELMISGEENIRLQDITQKQTEHTHIHDFFEIVYIAKGNGIHYIDGEEYRVSHGDLIFISRGQSHEFEIFEGIRMINILIAPEFISRELTGEDSILMLFKHSMAAEFSDVQVPPRQCVSFKGDGLFEIDALINLMLREHEEKNIGYRSVLQGGVKILFAKILRYLSYSEQGKSLEGNIVIEDVLRYVDENLSKKISLAELAAKSFYNPIYFSSLIKKHCGKSFSTYIREKRMSLAASLLKSTERSIDDIIKEAGYGDRKLFYSHFSETYGVTPGDYRKESLKKP